MYDVNVSLINVKCCFIFSFEGIRKDRIYRVGNYWAHHAMPRPETGVGARHQTENETNQGLICDHIKKPHVKQATMVVVERHGVNIFRVT